MSRALSHLDARRRPAMVDVTTKETTFRTARAEGRIRLGPETIELIRDDAVAKGSVLVTAELAGIGAAKRTSSLVPLCHPLMLTHVKVEAALEGEGVRVTAEVRCAGRTGVEMEALTAVSVALLTVYDMCKAVDKTMELHGIRLLEKKRAPLPIGTRLSRHHQGRGDRNRRSS
jgi:cyclic pyranopterin monophosphate synthase